MDAKEKIMDQINRVEELLKDTLSLTSDAETCFLPYLVPAKDSDNVSDKVNKDGMGTSPVYGKLGQIAICVRLINTKLFNILDRAQ